MQVLESMKCCQYKELHTYLTKAISGTIIKNHGWVMVTKISTDRLLLDVLTINDHAFIQAIVNSKGWLEFIGDRKVHSKEDALGYINKIQGTPNLTYWVVRLKTTDDPIGIISFLKRAYLENFDLGFAFLPEFSGQGYAYEAACEVMATLSQFPEYSPILAITLTGNKNSIRLLTKLGFKLDREIEEGAEKLYVYSKSLANEK